MKGGEKTDMSYTLSTADKEIANDATLYNLSHIYVKFDDSVSGLKMIYSKVTCPDNSVKYARTSWSETNKRFLIDFQFPTQKAHTKCRSLQAQPATQRASSTMASSSRSTWLKPRPGKSNAPPSRQTETL